MKPIKNVLPPVHGALGFISNAMNQVLESREVPVRVDPPTVIPLLGAIFESTLSFYCIHETPAWEYVDAALAKLIPEYDPESALAEALMELVIDPGYAWATEYLESIQATPWDVWIVSIGRAGTLILQLMGDYRVLEWEKLVREKQVTPPSRYGTKMSKAPIRGNVIVKQQPNKPVDTAPIGYVTRTVRNLEPIVGYRCFVGGRVVSRSTLKELSAALGVSFSKVQIAAMQTFNLVSDHKVQLQGPYGPMTIQTLWHEDRVAELLQLKAMALSLQMTPREPEEEINPYA